MSIKHKLFVLFVLKMKLKNSLVENPKQTKKIF